MLRDDALSLLATRLTRADLVTEGLAEMQLAQSRLELQAFLPWFLIKETTALVTAANQDTIALPSDFLRETEEDEGKFWLTDTSVTPTLYTELEKRTHGLLVAEFPDDIAAQPQKYAVVGSLIYLRPVPDAAYTTRLMYYGRAEALTSNIENAWLLNAPELLIARTGMQLSRYDADKGMYDMFKEDYALALIELHTADEARRQAGMDALMGEEDA